MPKSPNAGRRRVEVSQVEVNIEPVKVRVMPDGRMDSENAAKYTGFALKTMSMWRYEGRGPAFSKLSGRVFYLKDDLDAFMSGNAQAA